MKHPQWVVGSLLVWLLAMAPLASQAFSVSGTVSSSDLTDVVTDISDFLPANPPEGITQAMSAYTYTAETNSATYTATFTVTDDANELDTAPFVMGMGADISDLTVDTSVEPYQYTVTFTTGDLFIEEVPEGMQQFIFVFIGTVANPTLDNPEPGNGPPAAMSGGYIATTVQDFQIVPPSGPADAQFGVVLNGPAGESGFFKMKFPSTMLALMSTMSGNTITADALAVFVDDDQASLSVVETSDGGALMDIQITFADGSTDTQNVLLTDSTVSKEIVAKEKLDLSSALLSSTVIRSEQAKFYGWKKSGAANKTVKIYRQKSGGSFKLVDTVKTDETGYYVYKFKAKKIALKAGTYKFKAVSGGTTSDKQTLVITQ